MFGEAAFLQTVVVPLILAVGNGFTNTTTVSADEQPRAVVVTI